MWRAPRWLGLLGIALVGCGAPAQVRAPDGAALPSVARGAAEAPPSPAKSERPARTAAWLHLDDPATLVLALSALKGSSGGGGSLGPKEEELTAYLETIDLKRPIDAAVSLHKKKDTDVAVRLSFRDSKAFFKLLGAEFTLREEGDRIRMAKKGGSDLEAKPDDENANEVIVCEFDPPARTSDTAVCGTAHGVELFRDWLRTSPRPESSRAKHPLVHVDVFAAALRKRFARELSELAGGDASGGDASGGDVDTKRKESEELRRFAEDAESASFELAREGLSVAFSAELVLRSQTSTSVKDLLSPTNDGAPLEAFSRMSEDTSAAVFSPGGGPLPRWVDQLTTSEAKSTPEPARGKLNAAGASLAKLFGRPFAAAYGVHVERAKAAVAAIRTAKDPSKEKKVLDKALDGHGVLATATDIATVERTVRQLIAADVATEAAKPKPKLGPKDPRPTPPTTHLVRVAAARFGLPKGSFFVDETKAEFSLREAMDGAKEKGKPALPKMKTESTLFVPEGPGTTWAFLGDEERVLVESAKRTLAAPPSARTVDPMLRQPGVIVGGYLSSFVGAFAMHSLTSAFAPGGLHEDLVELEKDLTAPRLPIPFVLMAQRRGEGGVLRFETKGDAEAFKIVGEHLGFVGAGAALLVYALLLAAP
jgi:hypothetical protein